MSKLDLTRSSDQALVELTRSGIDQAFAELWRRHSRSATAAIRSFTGFDPEDIIQETFLRVFEQLKSGQGPTTAFRAYVAVTARNIATNLSRKHSSGEITGAEEILDAQIAATPDPAEQVLGSAVTMTAFKSLSTRWQEVLWYRDVEDLPVSECAQYLGMSENATSVLLKRAREGFKQSWIAANLDVGKNVGADCKWLIERLPKHTRGKMTVTSMTRLQSHLDSCARCAIVSEEANRIHLRLALVILPALLGGVSSLGYRAWIQSGEGRQSQLGSETSAANVIDFHSSSRSSRVVFTSAAAAVFLSAAAATAAIAAVPSWVTSDTPLPPGGSTSGPTSSEKVSLENPSDIVTSGGNSDPVSALSAPAAQMVPGFTPDEQTSVYASSNAAQATVPSSNTVSASPLPVMAKLTAVPVDGFEVGVYPNLSGTATPLSVIKVMVKNFAGDEMTETLSADADGLWHYTPHTVLGTLEIFASQTYRTAAGQETSPLLFVGSFEVGYGLEVTVNDIDPIVTIIEVAGLNGSRTTNQVVNVHSEHLGELTGGQELPDGRVVFKLPSMTPAEIGVLTYWQGLSSFGPVRTS